QERAGPGDDAEAEKTHAAEYQPLAVAPRERLEGAETGSRLLPARHCDPEAVHLRQAIGRGERIAIRLRREPADGLDRLLTVREVCGDLHERVDLDVD